MQFRSIADLNRDIVANLHRVPTDIDVVVGIPRSGMLPASIIALARNLPMADVHGFVEQRLLGTGSTRSVKQSSISFSELRHALIVDDSIDTGTSLQEARQLLSPLASQIRLTFCAVYSAYTSHGEVDLTFERVSQPRVFEWNVMHHGVLARSCVDIDGVLCLDPTDAQNDDGPKYLNFLLEATARTIPSQRIGTLVTSRLEKYRAETEQWLAKNGVKYDKLVMLDLQSAEERRRLAAHGDFKAQYYRKSNAMLFIESELRQAEEIAKISGKPVLSVEGPVMCYPRATPFALLQSARSARPRQKLIAAVKRILGPEQYKRAKTLMGR